MSTGHRQHHQPLQQVNNHSTSNSNNNSFIINNSNTDNNNNSIISQSNSTSVIRSKASPRHHTKYDRKFPSQQSSQGSEQSLIDLANQAQEAQSTGERPVGAVMGIFFKVWSLVKVSKARNQRLRHQTSDEPVHFQYIPGSQLPQSATSLSLDLSAHAPTRPQTPKHRLQVLQYPQASGSQTQTPGTNSTSSGVSSGSSVQTVNNRKQRLDSFAGSRAIARNNSSEISGAAPKKSSWASRIKRSATSINHSDFGARPNRWRRKSSERAFRQAEVAQHLFPGARARQVEVDHPEQNAEVDAAPEEGEEEEEEEEDSNNDIYSTPNDSIQSVAGSVCERLPFLQASHQHHYQQPAQAHNIQNKPFHMTKSFSANNFNHLLRTSAQGAQLLSTGHHQFESIAETAAVDCSSGGGGGAEESSSGFNPMPTDSAEPRQQRRLGRLNQNGARFFISSSSSEDSNSAKLAHHQTAALRQLSTDASHMEPLRDHQERHLVSVATSIALEEGVHCHQPARPDTLDLGPVSSLGASMTPLELSLLESAGAIPGASGGRLAAGYYKRSPTPMLAPNGDWWDPVAGGRARGIPNSMSLFDCKISAQRSPSTMGIYPPERPIYWSQLDTKESPESARNRQQDAEFELAQMLLESGTNPEARDSNGRSVLQLAVLSDNLPTLKCLLERRSVPIDATDADGCTALELACHRKPSVLRVEIVRLLVAHGAQLDCSSASSANSVARGARLIDRLIAEHRSFPASQHRLAYVECLLQAGAKIGSATWAAARGKLDIKVCLLTKLCQDGYYLYKESSLEAAVYRFEYALKRLTELERELLVSSSLPAVASQLKHQIYLGLSRCERKRRFYKRALEFAHMAILVDSTAYEGFYSKALILKELGHTDDALLAIHQTSWLLERSLALARSELAELEHSHETLMLARLSATRNPCLEQRLPQTRGTQGNGPTSSYSSAGVSECQRAELLAQLDYLEETRRFVGRLRSDIMDHKLGPDGAASQAPLATGQPTPATVASRQPAAGAM